MSVHIEEIARKLLKEAKNAGADGADTVVTDADSVDIEIRDGKLEHVERSEGADAGLRVLIGRRQACVAGSDLSRESLAAMAEQAVAMARVAPEDPYSGLAESDQLAENTESGGLELFDPAGQTSLERLKEMASEAEAAALAVKGVARTESASAGSGTQAVCIAASNGFSAAFRRSGASVSCAVISGSGLDMEVDYCFESRVFASDLPESSHIGTVAGKRAAARAGPSRPPTGAFPVIFDERVSSSLVGHLLSAINGAAVARGSSWLLNAVGSQILPENISLFEDPLLPRHQASKPFDAEGLPTAKKSLVKDGILKGWVLDLAAARKLGLESTGNASRGAASAPSPGVTNIMLPDGDKSREELVAEMGTGLIVTSLIGSTINPTTGDYSRGASGFWVEKGAVIGPVSEFTVAGNLRQFLKTVIAANDSRHFRRFRVPSLLVEGLTIAGA